MSSSNYGPPPTPPTPPTPPSPPRPPQFHLPQQPISPVTSGKAIGAFVLALLSFFFWILAALPALLLAVAAKSDIRRDPERVSGSGIANFAMLVAIVGIVIPPLVIGAVISSFDMSPSASFRSGPTLAHVHLSGFLPEPVAVQDAFSAFSGPPFSLAELLRAVRVAEKDNDIEGMIFTVDGFYASAAQREELIRAFQSFKDAGKKIYVHATTLDTGAFALFSHANRLSMTPTDSLFLTGMYSEGMYLAEAIEKLHADVQVIHIGEFKSAGEPFTRTGPSEEAEANQNWLIDNLYGHLVDSIAAGRDMKPDAVRDLIDGGPYSVDAAVESGLIDHVEFVDQFMKDIRDEYDNNVAIDDAYVGRIMHRHLQKGTGLTGLTSGRHSGANKSVAIVTIEGTILPGYGQNSPIGTEPGAYGDVVRKILQHAEQDNSIGAVVLRIDSPGGSVTASEVILRAVQELQKEKPVVVSMASVAASGGYYIACSADKIYADASTITGSIGVVGGKLVLGGTWDELGINFHPYQRGANADIIATAKPFNEEQVEIIRNNMESVYDIFLGHVDTHRGNLLTKPVAELAAGRVYTGAQALDLGLIDEIGGLQEAINHAATLAGLSSYEVTLIPRTKDFWTLLMQDLNGTGERPSDLASVARAMLAAHSDATTTPNAFNAMQHLDPVHTAALYEHFLALALLHRENVLALAPELIAK